MRTKGNRGFTLLEVCIAIGIFAIGCLTAMSAMVPAVRWGADAKRDFTAADAALSAVECLCAGGTLAGGLFQGGVDTNYPFAVQVLDGDGGAAITAAPGAGTKCQVLVFQKFLNPETGRFRTATSVDAGQVVDADTSTPDLDPIFSTYIYLAKFNN